MPGNEFRNNVLKVKGPRVHNTNASYGLRDAFLYYLKHKPITKEFVLQEKEFGKIIRYVNNKVRDNIALGETFYIPYKMGMITVIKRLEKPILKNGKLKIPMPVDWDKTLTLWENDKESYNSRQLLRRESGYRYRVKYRKIGVRYNNKTLIEFRANRELSKAVIENAKAHKLEALIEQ